MRMGSYVGFLGLLCAAAAFADEPAGKAKAAKAMKLVGADELKWVEVPDSGGVKLATLWGDPAKGAHGALHKFPAGFVAPLHHHTANVKVVVVSGTVLSTPEGSEERKLTAGSYAMIPGGALHTTKCDAASECVIFVHATGKFDLVTGQKTAAAGK